MKVMTNLDSILKSRDTTLPTKVHLVKAMVFPVVTYGCESWTIKKAECRRIDAFELWCCRTLLSSARRSNQSIIKEIIAEYSLVGLMLKLKLQYFGHLMQRTDSLEKPLMLGKIEGRRRKGRQGMRWLDRITGSMDMSLIKVSEIVKDTEVWHAAFHGFPKSRTWLSDRTELNTESNSNGRSLRVFLWGTIRRNKNNWLHHWRKKFLVLMTRSEVKVAQSCLFLCEPMDYTVHGILHTRILEWVAHPFSSRSSQLWDWSGVSWIGGRFFTNWTIREVVVAFPYWMCALEWGRKAW